MRTVMIVSAFVLALGVPAAAAGQLGIQVRADPPGPDEKNLNGEVAVVSNDGTVPLDLSGWLLCDAVAICYAFPDGTGVGPGADLRVHTGSGHDTLTDLYMGRASPLWDNWADIATLRDADGGIRARCYWDRGRGLDCSPP